MLICICCVIFITRLRVSFCIKLKKKKIKKKKISKKAILKQIVRLSQIVCFNALYEQWGAPFVEQHTHAVLSGKSQRKVEFFW